MDIRVSTQNLVLCLSEAIDLISSSLSDHHKLVAATVCQICEEMGLPAEDKRDIIYASALHDVGALSESEKVGLVQMNYEMDDGHAKKGSLFFRDFEPFSDVAKYILYHHTNWNPAWEFDYSKNKVYIASNILFLADRIAVSIHLNRGILSQRESITEVILRFGKKFFAEELLEIFLKLSSREAFWLNIVTYSLEDIFRRFIPSSLDKTVDNYQFIRIFSRIIDFRSTFTATHSSGVAAAAKALAQLAGFSEENQEKIEIAGFVHDLGKLAVPSEILEKNGSLSKEEFSRILAHTYYTDFLLSKLEDFDDIRHWAAQHHEKLDGSGYPFHLCGEQISVGSRIMAVSDVFTALFEDRPYRKGMEKETALGIIRNMSGKALDAEIVQLLFDNFEYVNTCRIQAQTSAAEEYGRFKEALQDRNEEGEFSCRLCPLP